MGEKEQKPPLNEKSFFTAVLLAPGIAITTCFIGLTLSADSVGLHEVGSFIGNLLLALVIVSIWGFFPSLFFGGLVLGLIQSVWPGRPSGPMFVAGGILAAGLYVLSGLGVAEVSPGAAMLFAPWAMPDVRGSNSVEDGWVLASLLLSGAGAGLIYAAIAKRG